MLCLCHLSLRTALQLLGEAVDVAGVVAEDAAANVLCYGVRYCCRNGYGSGGGHMCSLRPLCHGRKKLVNPSTVLIQHVQLPHHWISGAWHGQRVARVW